MAKHKHKIFTPIIKPQNHAPANVNVVFNDYDLPYKAGMIIIVPIGIMAIGIIVWLIFTI